MLADLRVLELMSYYRDAELRGATLLLRLLKMMEADVDAQIKLTRHVADETRHAWLWTKRMTEIGGAPVKIAAGYQTRIGMRTMPRTLAELLALTIVVEERSLARYQEHAARSNVDEATRKVLRQVASDEEWHVAWMREKLKELTDHDPTGRERVAAMMERYRRVDEEVYGALLAREKEVFGEDVGAFGNPPVASSDSCPACIPPDGHRGSIGSANTVAAQQASVPSHDGELLTSPRRAEHLLRQRW